MFDLVNPDRSGECASTGTGTGGGKSRHLPRCCALLLGRKLPHSLAQRRNHPTPRCHPVLQEAMPHVGHHIKT